MNCEDMMKIPELKDVLKLRTGEMGLQQVIRWVYFADCLQCIKKEYKMEDYIHGGEFVILTNRSVTEDSQKLMTLIGQMQEYHITALGINEGQISEELMEYCDHNNLPLFELPEKYPLIDLSQIMCRRLVLEENDRNRAEQLFSSILDAEHLNRDQVMEQAQYLNISLEGNFCVSELVFEKKGDNCEKGDSLTVGQSIKHMISTEFSFYINETILILPQAGAILVLIPTTGLSERQIRDIFTRIADRVQKEFGFHLCVGVGDSTAYLDEIRKSRNEASAAIRAAVASHMSGQIFFYRDQGIYTLISHVNDTRILDKYVKQQLGTLLRYDELNEGNLCETLENYLSHNCNGKKTAEAMFIHRNTLNHRLKKVEDLTDCDLEDLEKCLEMKLAFMILRYRNSRDFGK